MNGKKLAILALAAVCTIVFAGEASARGGGWGAGQGAGIRLQKRDGSCIRNTAQTPTQTRAGQQLRNGAGPNGAGAGRSAGQGAMRKLGPGDGTGNATRPMDGTGYGSPAK